MRAADPLYLQLQNHLHPVPTQWADVVQDQRRDDVDAVGLVSHDTCLKNRNPRRGSVFLWTPSSGVRLSLMTVWLWSPGLQARRTAHSKKTLWSNGPGPLRPVQPCVGRGLELIKKAGLGLLN